MDLKIKNPVFIIGSYRGGTSLLFRLLSESDELFSIYRESNHLWQDYHRHPDEKSDTVFADELEKITNLDQKRKNFDIAYHFSSYNSYILGYLGRVKLIRERLPFMLDLINFVNFLVKNLSLKTYRIIDKTPPNIFRVQYLAKLYPDAKFIYLTRDANENINSLISAWCHKSKFKYPYRKYLGELKLKDCDSKVWKFYIPKDFNIANYQNKEIASICAEQWLSAHKAALAAFENMDSSRFIKLKFEDLLSRPKTVIKELCSFAKIKFDNKMQKIIQEMPAVNTDTKDLSQKTKDQARLDALHPEIKKELDQMQKLLGYNQVSYAI